MTTKMMKKDKAQEKMPKGKAGIAIMIGIGKPKKMATGGMPKMAMGRVKERQISAPSPLGSKNNTIANLSGAPSSGAKKPPQLTGAALSKALGMSKGGMTKKGK